MSATTSGRKAPTSDTDPKERLATTARQAADTVAGAAGEMAARFPEAASTTREAIGEANRAFQEANRMVKAGSEETLKVVGAELFLPPLPPAIDSSASSSVAPTASS